MPTSRVTQNVASFLTKCVLLAGNVLIGASGAVSTRTGRGFTITRTGTGLYTVTIDGVGALPIVFANAVVVHATAHVAVINTITPSARTFTLTTATAAAPGTAADPPNGAVLQVHAVLNNMPLGQN
jgi:hypothetical protein